MYIVATSQNRIIIQIAMNAGKYIFSQIVAFLPQRQFERIVKKYTDIAKNWNPRPGLTCWPSYSDSWQAVVPCVN